MPAPFGGGMEAVRNFFRWYWDSLGKTSGPYFRFLGMFVAGLLLIAAFRIIAG